MKKRLWSSLALCFLSGAVFAVAPESSRPSERGFIISLATVSPPVSPSMKNTKAVSSPAFISRCAKSAQPEKTARISLGSGGADLSAPYFFTDGLSIFEKALRIPIFVSEKI